MMNTYHCATVQRGPGILRPRSDDYVIEAGVEFPDLPVELSRVDPTQYVVYY